MPTSRKTQSGRKLLAGRRAKKVPSKKPKRSRTERISAKVFEEKFTAIVTGYLSTLPLEEQNTRIREAEEVAAIRRRDAVSTK
jgi:hypothetical protein